MPGVDRTNGSKIILNILTAGLLLATSVGWAAEVGLETDSEAAIAAEIADEVMSDYAAHAEEQPIKEVKTAEPETAVSTPPQAIDTDIVTRPNSSLPIVGSATPDDFIMMALYGVLLSFIVLLIAGVTNKTVIFYDYNDLLWTLTPILSLLLGTVISFSIIEKQQNLTDSFAATAIFASSCIIAVFASFKSFAAAIKHNGKPLGIVIGIFKLVTSSLTAICAIGIAGRLLSGSTSLKARSFYLIFFAGLVWMLTKLVNGKTVYAQRYEHIQTA